MSAAERRVLRRQKVLASGADRLARLEGAKTATTNATSSSQTPPSPSPTFTHREKTAAEAETETASPAATAGIGRLDSGTPELDSMAHAQAKRAAEARETSSGKTPATAPAASTVAAGESHEATRAFEEAMASAFAGMNDSYVTPHVPDSELLPGSASRALVAASTAVLQPATPPHMWQLHVTVMCAAIAGLYGGNNESVAVRHHCISCLQGG